MSVVRPRGDRGSAVPGAGVLGLSIFIASLTVLFLCGIVAYIVVRSRAESWPPPGAPPLPWGLWISTACLLACSVALHGGLIAIRRGDQSRLRRRLGLGCLFATGFCISQLGNWLYFYRADTTFHGHLYGFTFYMLTGLHAAHVLGGLIPLGLVTRRAWRGDYSWGHYPGVLYTTIYWHFLDLAWIALLIVMLIDR